MANIRTCDAAGCSVVGKVGKGQSLRRVSETVHLTNPTPLNPFRCMTVLWDLCPEHANVAREWAARVGGSADFSDLDASDVGVAVKDEPS